MKKLFTAALMACFAGSTMAQYYLTPRTPAYDLNASPKREIRAVWLTTLGNLDWPKTYATSPENIERQKKELTDILDKYAAANINTVLLQARVRAATIYPSDYEPWDQCITGRAGQAPDYGYDPLKFAVEECHKRGMEIHAWLAAIPIGASKALGAQRMRERGFDVRSYSTGAYVNPADPKIADYLAEICAEITRKYDIDGINLDYIRYPDSWPKASYREGDTPDERRANITKIVRAIHDKVKALKPWVKISCSPIGKHADLMRYSSKGYNAREKVYQDAQLWIKRGYMDQLYPMQYFRDQNYYPFCADWVENSNGKDIVTGLGTYFLDPHEGSWTLADIKRQMYVSRSLGMGHAHFRSKYLTDNRQGVYDFERLFNFLPALPPAMTWMGKQQPQQPKYRGKTGDLKTIDSDHRVTIAWRGNAPYYNIYASFTYPVDVSDARNLVFGRYADCSFMVKTQSGRPLYYAITAMDRYGNESEPLQERRLTTDSRKEEFLAVDNDKVMLPEEAASMDTDFFLISSLAGNTIARKYVSSASPTKIDVFSLPNGVYELSAHSKRNKSVHRIGFFILKR